MQTVGDAVYTAIHETLDLLGTINFQVLTEDSGEGLIYDPNDLGVVRTEDVAFIQAFLRRGRSVEMKQAITRQSCFANAGVSQRCTLTENDVQH